jgi:hypothetical protein
MEPIRNRAWLTRMLRMFADQILGKFAQARRLGVIRIPVMADLTKWTTKA